MMQPADARQSDDGSKARLKDRRRVPRPERTAQDSVGFVKKQLAKDSTDAQSWQFTGTAINYYCPDQRFVYEQAAH